MDLEQEYLRSLDGSSIAVWRFFEERLNAAFAAVRQSELIFEFDDFPADADFSVRATAVATAAIEGMALLDAPSDEYLSAVSTLYKVSELALLWDSLLSETESGQGELLARAILLTKSTARRRGSSADGSACDRWPKMARPPEPFPGFEGQRAMPEVADHTVGELGQRGMGLGLICRDCGREAAFTPLGIRTQLHRYRDTPVPVFARACRCQTCEGANVVAHGAPLEPHHQARPYILFRERRAGPRLDRL